MVRDRGINRLRKGLLGTLVEFELYFKKNEKSLILFYA